MASQHDSEVLRLVELVAQLVRERDDTGSLLAAFRRGEISNEQIVNELASRYQSGIGGAVRALAEHDKDAAQQLGERLRSRLDGFLAELGAGETASLVKRPRSSNAESFRDRDDAVLRREYAMMKLLAHSNDAVRSASIFAAVRSFDKDVQDEAMTAHLARLVKAGMVGRERKGRYHGLPQGAAQLTALAAEIEARGLTLPAVPDRLAD